MSSGLFPPDFGGQADPSATARGAGRAPTTALRSGTVSRPRQSGSGSLELSNLSTAHDEALSA
jgi:hypothetical protein